jgi:PKD repeat protein
VNNTRRKFISKNTIAMKNFIKLSVIVFCLLNFQYVKAQNVNYKGFELMGKNPKTIQINQTISQNTELFPFKGKIPPIFGLALKANITLNDEKSLVRVILVDTKGDEFLVYETYPLLEESNSVNIDNLCEETGLLSRVQPKSLRIEVESATIKISSITYSVSADQITDVIKTKKDKKDLQNSHKISQINNSIKVKGLSWVAGETEVSALSYADKKKLYGQSTFPSGIEYYVGGIMQIGNEVSLKSAAISSMVENWDWRYRHGKNWVTEVKNQGNCGSCWAFAATGATEAAVNLFYNQPLNMNLSEQNLLSCSGAGSCSGGYPSTALDYVKNTGIIDETAFPYTATDQVCTNKSSNPTDQIKISGRENFGSSNYPVSEDNLKKMIIKYGPLSGGLLDWSHAMTLVGWQVVKEGDRFYYRDLNKSTYWYTVPSGSTLIGKTIWIFKNSWGVWGDGGYVYVETSINNFAWTHALLGPLTSLKQNYTVQCVDNDHDGYYWWGLGAKPANCPPCPAEEDGNDADATLGPLDINGNCIPLTTVAPVADFLADKVSMNENTSVYFTDLSANKPTSWAWTFDGGTPSTSNNANPIISYATAGTYNVTLVATNAAGSNTKIKTGYITVNVAQVTPIADFVADKVSMNENTSVYFTDLSANKPTSWAWTFDGGTPSTSNNANPIISYATAGTYNVTLVATNAAGSNTKVKTGYITVNVAPVAPVADFVADKVIVNENSNVNFTDLSSNAPATWAWTFDGGTPATSSAANPVVSYKTAGKYNVNLVVTNANGNSTKIKTAYITVNSIVPVYCASKGTAATEWISKIAVNGSTVSSNSSGSAGYADLTANVFNVTASTTSSITLTPGYSGKINSWTWSVWIDWNNDADFDDAGEQVLSVSKVKTAVTKSINIPATALTGFTRMRVSMKRNVLPTACEIFSNGEVKDYTVNISAPAEAALSLKKAEIGNPDLTQPESFTLFPNPAIQMLNLKVDNLFDQDTYSIFNIQGALICKKPLDSNLTQVDISGLSEGIYIMKVKNGVQTFQEKFLKKR